MLTVYVVVGIVGNEPLSFPSASYETKKTREGKVERLAT